MDALAMYLSILCKSFVNVSGARDSVEWHDRFRTFRVRDARRKQHLLAKLGFRQCVMGVIQ